MAQGPKPLVRRDQGFRIPAQRDIGRQWPVQKCCFQNLQQLLGHLHLTLFAGMVEGDHDLADKAAAIGCRPCILNVIWLVH